MEADIKTALEEILGSIESLGDRVTKLEASPSAQVIVASCSPKKISVKEYLLECKPNGNVQKMLAIGHYLESQSGMASFNKADLEKGFRAAKEPLPANINATANECVGHGFMMEYEEKKDNMKAWVLTGAGEKFIMKGFVR